MAAKRMCLASVQHQQWRQSTPDKREWSVHRTGHEFGVLEWWFGSTFRYFTSRLLYLGFTIQLIAHRQQRQAWAVLQIPAKTYPALGLCWLQNLVIPRPPPLPARPQWVSGHSPESVRMARSDIARNPDVGYIWHPAQRSEVIDAANLREVCGKFSTYMASNHDQPSALKRLPIRRV